MTEQPKVTADERDAAWRMAVELANRPTWPNTNWYGSPADAKRQLSQFSEAIINAAAPVRTRARYVVDRAIQLVRSAAFAEALLDENDTERIKTEDRARTLVELLTPVAAVADRILNDLVDRYGFRPVLTPRPENRRKVLRTHVDFAPDALTDGIRAFVDWSDHNHDAHRTLG